MAYTGNVWLVGRAGPVFSSQIAYVVTLSGVGLSILILGEAYSATVWLALGLMIGALALVTPQSPVEPEPDEGLERRRASKARASNRPADP